MNGSVYMAASGAMIQHKRMEVISNNLANINTAGFKKEMSHFKVNDSPEDLKEESKGEQTSRKIETLPLWQQFGTLTDFSQGDLKRTGNDLDIALSGKGFFCVQTPDGIRYTRNGQMTLNKDGVLSTQDGYPVLSEGGTISITGKNFEVDDTGTVFQDGNEIGELRIVDFEDANRLQKSGSTLFKTIDPDDNGKDAEPSVRQGYIESANVDTVRMMTEMIEVLRGYESYQKIMKSMDDITGKMINDVGKTS